MSGTYARVQAVPAVQKIEIVWSTPSIESVQPRKSSAFEQNTPANTLTSSASQYKTLKYCEYYCTSQYEILKYSEY